jgi:rhamnosyltransferase
MEKILGIVVLYFPVDEVVIKNISSYVNHINKLIIWDNTPESARKTINFSNLFPKSNIFEITPGENKGLAIPYNEAIKVAQSEGFDYLLTMDQDSHFENTNFELYYSRIKLCSDQNIGIFSPNINGSGVNGKNIIEVRTAISSGAIYPVSIFNKVGNFIDNFFIYMLDIEFCFRVKKQNMSVVCMPDINMIHEEGYSNINSLGMKINNYSAQSTYYIIRNTIFTWKLYPEFTTKEDKKIFYKYKIFFRLLKLIFEENKFAKLKAIFFGLLHGMNSKGGFFNI